MEIIDIAKEIAIACGEILKAGFNNILEIEEKTGPGDIVTDVDRRSETYATKQIMTLRPDDGLLGEEGVSVESKNGYMWIIDPLDGTYNFALGIPLFCVSIGVYYNNEPFVGVIYDPIHNEMYSAQRGKGAYLNNKKLEIKPYDGVSDAVLYLSWVKGSMERKDFNTKVQTLFEKTSHIRRLGSAAIGFAYLASNRIHGFVEVGLKPWDVAAAIVIIMEAGGTVTDFYGDKIDITQKSISIITAGKELYSDLYEEINK